MNLGGPAFSLDSDGSLLITSPSGNETGEFICTATNAAGYASRKVQLIVYGKHHYQAKCWMKSVRYSKPLINNINNLLIYELW